MKLQASLILAVVLLLAGLFAFADDPFSDEDGADQYDWTVCLDNKILNCKNACSSSDDLGCYGDCEAMASDKCKSEGLKPPE